MPITDIHSITGYHLKDIRVIPDENEYGGEEYLEILFLVEEDRALRLVPIPETDEIHAEVVAAGAGHDLVALPEGHWMNDLIGLKLGYVWTCTNSQGYDDLIVLSFEFLMPNLAIVCECSTLKILRMIRQSGKGTAV